MKMLKTYTLTELAEKLRASGASISHEGLKIALDNGFLAGCVFPCSEKSSTFLIIAKDVDQWIETHSLDIEPSTEMMEVARAMQKNKEAC